MADAAKIVSCVPNVSEGIRQDVIDKISEAIKSTESCTLLEVSAGASTNRTVYTFIGTPASVVEAALKLSKVAYDLIDMSLHRGEHPRMGVVDVCPFVPVSGVTVEDCITCSQVYGRRLAEMLNVPVFLYEESATRPHCKALNDIRKGEYEGLPERLKNSEWKPDFGPDTFVARWGATATGVRDYLIAYNVNLIATKNQAHRIALDIRENGRGPKSLGTLKSCKAIGWYLEESDLSQVSINLTNFHVTNIHTAFEECKRIANELNLPVVGSEVVSLLPLKAMLLASDYYIKKENLFILDEKQKIRLVIDRLGLNSLSIFRMEEKIVEYKAGLIKSGPLISLSVKEFLGSLRARTAAPGGGSASALVASVGTSLGTMVGWMTYGWKKFEHLDHVMRETIPPLYQATEKLMDLIDRDSEAFKGFQVAMALPKETAEQAIKREEAMQEALKHAVDVPLQVIRISNTCWPHLVTMAHHGNINTKSDLQVGAISLKTGIQGAKFNVDINLVSLTDEEFKSHVKQLAEESLKTAEMKCSEVLQCLLERNP